MSNNKNQILAIVIRCAIALIGCFFLWKLWTMDHPAILLDKIMFTPLIPVLVLFASTLTTGWQSMYDLFAKWMINKGVLLFIIVALILYGLLRNM